MEERIQKIISDSGTASRRRAEQLITEGRVRVDGRTAVLGEKADRETAVITIDGVPIGASSSSKVYLMLNKPKGYVTTLSDEKDRPCVAQLVRDAGRRVYPVGRLDMYSEGLLLLTDDGDFANRMMHPSHEVNKVYLVSVDGEDISGAAERLSGPMEIDGYRIKPAEVRLLSRKGRTAELEVTIHEGRNRQVRKMCDQAGLHVRNLKRIAEGPLQLGELASGTWRYLTPEEIESLKTQE